MLPPKKSIDLPVEVRRSVVMRIFVLAVINENYLPLKETPWALYLGALKLLSLLIAHQ